MARTADKVVKWLYQNADQSLIWSWVDPNYYLNPGVRLIAFGWKYGKVTWMGEDNA